MKFFAWDVRPSLKTLVECFLTDSNDIRRSFLFSLVEKTSCTSKGSVNQQEKDQMLQVLVSCLLDPLYTLSVVRLFRPLLPELMARLLRSHRAFQCLAGSFCCSSSSSSPSPSSSSSSLGNKMGCTTRVLVCLSRILPLFPQSFEIIFQFFSHCPSPLDSLSFSLEPLSADAPATTTSSTNYSEVLGSFLALFTTNSSCSSSSSSQQKEIRENVVQLSKSTKEERMNEKMKNKNGVHILLSALRFLRFSSTTFRNLWNWTPVISLLSHSDPLIRSLAKGCAHSLFSVSQELSLLPKPDFSVARKEKEREKMDIDFQHHQQEEEEQEQEQEQEEEGKGLEQYCQFDEDKELLEKAVLWIETEIQTERSLLFCDTRPKESQEITIDVDLSDGRVEAIRHIGDVTCDRVEKEKKKKKKEREGKGERGKRREREREREEEEEESGTVMITELNLSRDVVVDLCGVLLFRRHHQEKERETDFLGGEEREERGEGEGKKRKREGEGERRDGEVEGKRESLSTLESRKFVYTSTSEELMVSLALSVRQSFPVLLSGIPGSGKCLLFFYFFLFLFMLFYLFICLLVFFFVF